MSVARSLVPFRFGVRRRANECGRFRLRQGLKRGRPDRLASFGEAKETGVFHTCSGLAESDGISYRSRPAKLGFLLGPVESSRPRIIRECHIVRTTATAEVYLI